MDPLPRFVRPALLVALLIGAANDAFTQARAASAGAPYPSRPLRMIVPYAPGGGNDTMTRAVGQRLAEHLGQPVVVDNRAGAGGVLGAEIVAKAAPDGYTLLMGSSSLAVNASLVKRLPYDPVKDFAAVALVGATSYLLAVHPSLPSKSVPELVALAKARPGQLNYASGGIGSPLHLAAEQFKALTGTSITHIPYKGGVPAVAAVLSGEAQLVFGSVTTTMPAVKAGRLRGLAVTGAQRSVLLPELPTVAEAGVPGFETTNWYGVLAPAGTPKAVIARLNSGLMQVLQLPELKERLLSGQGIEALGSTPERFAAFLRADVAKWAKLTREIGIRAE